MTTNTATAKDLALAAAMAPVRGRIYGLCGDSMSGTRQAIVQVLTGNKEPKSKCGATRVEKMIFEYLNAEGSCLARRADFVSEWYRSMQP